jgi:hypothetical protein
MIVTLQLMAYSLDQSQYPRTVRTEQGGSNANKTKGFQRFMSPLPDLYGECALDKCECLQPGQPWLGLGCSNWKSFNLTTTEDLLKAARAIREKLEKGNKP